MERHCISNKEEFRKVCQHLKDIFEFAKGISKNSNMKAFYSLSHEWPAIEFQFSRAFDKQKRYYIKKIIILTLRDYEYPPVYKLSAIISNDYGYEENPEGYISKCHLCLDIRKHIIEKTDEFSELVPKEFYNRI